jgi:hypothetical protein
VTDRLTSTKLRDVCASHGVKVVETTLGSASPDIVPAMSE